MRRGNIAGQAQEVARHLRAINITADTRRQEPSDSTERPTVTTAITERSIVTATTIVSSQY